MNPETLAIIYITGALIWMVMILFVFEYEYPERFQLMPSWVQALAMLITTLLICGFWPLWMLKLMWNREKKRMDGDE